MGLTQRKVVMGKGGKKRSREMESPAELTSKKTTSRYHLRKRKREKSLTTRKKLNYIEIEFK